MKTYQKIILANALTILCITLFWFILFYCIQWRFEDLHTLLLDFTFGYMPIIVLPRYWMIYVIPLIVEWLGLLKTNIKIERR